MPRAISCLYRRASKPSVHGRQTARFPNAPNFIGPPSSSAAPAGRQCIDQVADWQGRGQGRASYCGDMRQLLSDIAVVELAQGVAGSYCGKLFADLGATVVKVERPGGDPLRSDPAAPTIPPGGTRTGAVLHHNTNKRSVVL